MMDGADQLKVHTSDVTVARGERPEATRQRPAGRKEDGPKFSQGRLDVSGRAMLVAVVVLGLFYGACMGCYNVVVGNGAQLQILSRRIKVPASSC